MKVFLIMIVCLQDPFLELGKSCITVPMKEQFQSVPECIYFVEGFKQRNYNSEIFMTGFCTTKQSI
jgi:hypothetical protein